MCLLVFEYAEVDEAENNAKLLAVVIFGKIYSRQMCGVLTMECTAFPSKVDRLSESRN